VTAGYLGQAEGWKCRRISERLTERPYHPGKHRCDVGLHDLLVMIGAEGFGHRARVGQLIELWPAGGKADREGLNGL
jgi:hypothetical protein